MQAQLRPILFPTIVTYLLLQPALFAAETAGVPLRVVLLKEPGMPVRGIHVDLESLLGHRPDVVMSTVDSTKIVSQGIEGDVFCNAHGEVYPRTIEDRLFEFLQRGGGLLHLGGAPFETAVERRDGKWVEVVRTFEQRHAPHALEQAGPKKEPFDLFRSRLGIVTYVPPFAWNAQHSPAQRFDAALIGSAGGGTTPSVGISVCSTIPMHAVDPEYLGRYSTAYLAKPVCRETHDAGQVVGPHGRPILTSLALVKSWGNPYGPDQRVRMRPWVISTVPVDDKFPKDVLDAMLRWLGCPVCLRPIDLPLATTRRGETVEASGQLAGQLPNGWRLRGRRAEVTLDQFKAGEPVRWLDADIEARPDRVAMKVTDQTDAFLLPIRFEIRDEQGRVRDLVESAVVPWRPERLTIGPRLTVDGHYFDYRVGSQTASASFLVGANWQDRVQYGFTWHNPNGLRVARDARQMAADGLRIMRTHYMLPGWMRTVPGQIYASALPGVYDPFELGPEMSERHLRALEAHVMIFNALGIVFQPTVFTLPPPQMGHPATWMFGARLASCPGLIENQKRFSQQMMQRFGQVRGISWDLVNEPNDDMTRFGEWLTAMKPIWGATHQTVGIGTHGILDNVRLGEAADWHSRHVDFANLKDSFDTGKPHVLQEVWMPTPTTRAGESELAHCMSLTVAITLRERAAGLMPWNWNQFQANWRYGGSFVEFWDNDLGSCVHPDATPRSGSVMLRNWAALLDGLSFDQRADQQVVFVYPKTFYSGAGTAEYIYALHQQGVPFHAINDTDFDTANLKGVRLVVVPYTARGYRDSTWNRLRKFAAAGGIVFAHNDTLMLDEDGQIAKSRQIPLRDGREPVGSGAFQWIMGWNSLEQGRILNTFQQTIDTLKLDRYRPHVLPLVDGGQIRFRDVARTHRTTMKHDWFSAAPMPDRAEPLAVEVVDRQGHLLRGWASEGQSLEWGLMKFRSPGQLFLLRNEPGHYVLAGRTLVISGCGPIESVRLVDPISGRACEERPVYEQEGQELTIRLSGPQQLMAVEVRTAPR
jgi:hypothetical protein